MAQEKRRRAAAIILIDGKIVSMYREFGGRQYYTFPGGGMEKDEDEKDCVVREVQEEFGMTVKPIRKLYTYEDEKSLEYYYLCRWVSGEFGSGTGEEFQPDRNRGIYRPTLIKVSDIPNLTLYPEEVAKTLTADFLKFGDKFDAKQKKIFGHRI